MTPAGPLHACPACPTPTPPERVTDEPWCCSISCYRAFHHIDPPNPRRVTNSVTIICPVCQRSFTPVGRQKYCCDACRAAAYRRRRDTRPATLVVPKSQPRRPITVYQCDTCGARSLGEQRCTDCATFMRKIGIGGSCPGCDEPVAVAELVGQEVITSP